MNPITFPAIEAWARLTRRAPSPRDVQVITALDGELLRFCHEQQQKREQARQRGNERRPHR